MFKVVVLMACAGLISELSLSAQALQAWSIECPPKAPFSYCLIAGVPTKFVWLSQDWTVLGIMAFPWHIEIRDPYTGLFLRQIVIPDDFPRTRRFKGIATFSPDGRLLATPISDHTIWVWEVETGRVLWRLPGVFSAAFGPAGKLLYCSGLAGEITVWDMDTGTQVQSLRQLEPVKMTKVWDISPDGRWLVALLDMDIECATYAAKVVWDLYTGNIVRVFSGRWVSFLPKDQVLLLVRGCDLVVWEVLGPKTQEMRIPFIPLEVGETLTVRRDGQYIAFALADGTVRFWKVDTAQEVAKLDLKALLAGRPDVEFQVIKVEFSPDGDCLLTVVKIAKEIQIHLWNISGLLAGK